MKKRINLIFVVEASKQSQSDYYYLRRLMSEVYYLDSFRPEVIFANGKGNLSKQDKIIERKIKDLPGESKVIIVADVDKYNNSAFLLNDGLTEYCEKKGYDLVWMNYTIEDVFLGETVEYKVKKQKALRFISQTKIIIDENKLKKLVPKTERHSSNIVYILDRYLIRRKKS